MSIIDLLYAFAKQNDLIILDILEIEELGNQIVFTKYSKPIFSVINFGSDNFSEVINFVNLKGSHCDSYTLEILASSISFNDNEVILIGKTQVLIVTNYEIGANLIYLKSPEQLLSFFKELYISKTYYKSIILENYNNERWIKCWRKLNDITNFKLEGTESKEKIYFKLLEKSFVPPFYKNSPIGVLGHLGRFQNDKIGYNFVFQLNPVKINFYYYREHHLNGVERIDNFLYDSESGPNQFYTSSPEYLFDFMETELIKYPCLSELRYSF